MCFRKDGEDFLRKKCGYGQPSCVSPQWVQVTPLTIYWIDLSSWLACPLAYINTVACVLTLETVVPKDTRRWRQQRADVAAVERRGSRQVFCSARTRCLCLCRMYERIAVIWNRVVASALCSPGAAETAARPPVSTCSGEITTSAENWSPRCHVSVVDRHTCVHFPPSQPGVSVSKLVVCYAGDFWGRGQL